MAAVVTQVGAVMPNSGTMALRVYCSIPSQISINTIHFAYEKTAGTTMKYSEPAQAFADAVSPAYAALMGGDGHFRGVKAADVSVMPRPMPGIVIDDVPGTQDSPIVPAQAAGIATFLTDFAGPGGRGRIYVPFASVQDMAENGYASGAYVVNLTALRVAIVTFLAVVGVNASYSFSPVIRNMLTGVNRLITSGRSNARFGTQKKRGAYGQVNNTIIT